MLPKDALSGCHKRSDLFGSSKFYMDNGYLKKHNCSSEVFLRNPLQFPVRIEERQVINEFIIHSCAGIL